MGGLPFLFVLVGCGAGKGDDAVSSDADVDVDADVDADADADSDTDAACSAVEPETCYFGPDGTVGIGVCRAGLRSCIRGRWTSCNGQVVPVDEVCNGLDDDCDEEVDEGVTNACGTCGSGDSCDCVGVGCAEGFGDGEGVVVGDDGALELSPGTTDGVYEWIEDRWAEGGCCLTWHSLDWEAETPDGTSITIETRGGDTMEELDAAAWVALATLPPDAPPAALPFESFGPWLVAFRFVLHTDGAGTPRLVRISVTADCSLAIC